MEKDYRTNVAIVAPVKRVKRHTRNRMLIDDKATLHGLGLALLPGFKRQRKLVN